MRKRIISYLIILAGLGFILLPHLNAQGKAVEVIWTAMPVAIDGNNQEWTEIPVTTDKKLAVDYAFSHDGRNLYILFIFNDPKFLSTINDTGMVIYFSPANKKSKDFGLKFVRKTVGGEELAALMEKRGTPLDDEQKAQLAAKPQARYLFYEADIIGKKGEVIAPHNQEGIDAPGFRVGRSGKSIVYEFRVPLAAQNVYTAGIGFQPGQSLRIGFEWGGMTPQMRQAMMARMASESSLARASETSLDRTISGADDISGLGSSGGGGPRLGSTPKKYSFWVDVKLSAEQK